ncbi:MAG: hypothetical protein U0T73_14025 [Chitinophagales bacterium]
MNYKQLLSIALFAIPALVFGQKEIKVDEVEKEMTLGTKTAFVTVIPQAKLKDVNDAWKKLLKKDSKGKLEEAKGEVLMNGAVNRNISPIPFTVVSKTMETSDGIQLTAWLMDGDVIISSASSPDKGAAAIKMIHDFAAGQYREAVKDEVEKEKSKQNAVQKVFDGYVKDQKSAEDNITKAKHQIEELQNKIKTEEENIVKAKDMQVKSKADLDAQINVVKTVTDKMNNIK